jgi:hypothetical protein
MPIYASGIAQPRGIARNSSCTMNTMILQATGSRLDDLGVGWRFLWSAGEP